MERLDDLHGEEERTLAKINRLFETVRKVVAVDAKDVPAGINSLETLRQSSYEDINQIQHEAMILRAARYLVTTELCEKDVVWRWNPRQTGSGDEPDLRGTVDGRIVISAEITTSERPVGTIDTRMADTLKKLAAMSGKRFYFVRTDAMRSRAETKVRKGQLNIEVRLV